jgi:hypothetical protein
VLSLRLYLVAENVIRFVFLDIRRKVMSKPEHSDKNCVSNFPDDMESGTVIGGKF